MTEPGIAPTCRATDQDHLDRDTAYVRAAIHRIMMLSAADRTEDARGASADLLFDYQPLIVASPDLLSLCFDALLRCDATALSRRLLVAARGDSTVFRIAAPGSATLEPAPLALARQSA